MLQKSEIYCNSHTTFEIDPELLETLVISSKYTSEYPTNPKNLFKSHLTDLAYTIECFKNSKLNSDLNQQFSTVSKTEITGILVWLSNNDDVNFDIKPKVWNSAIDKDLVFNKIILLDNQRINFLYETIFKIKKFYKDADVSFVYHNSSLNLNTQQSFNYGKTFPINYVYSDMIPLRVETTNNINLMLFINDDFSKDNLSQILFFSKSFNRLNSVDKTIINFKTYDSLYNEQDVKSILVKYPKFNLNKNLIISKFPTDFRDYE